MFVSDFMERYVKEKKNEILKKQESSERMLFTSGIEYDGGLLEKATVEDWRKLYSSTFNFLQYGFAVTFNAESGSIVAGKEPDDEELEKVLDHIVSARGS